MCIVMHRLLSPKYTLRTESIPILTMRAVPFGHGTSSHRCIKYISGLIHVRLVMQDTKNFNGHLSECRCLGKHPKHYQPPSSDVMMTKVRWQIREESCMLITCSRSDHARWSFHLLTRSGHPVCQ